MWEVRDALEYHREMVCDEARTSAYAKAIARVVRPGDVVVDLGAGTGILAMLAARAGARRVYAIESARVAELARRVVAANGLDGIVKVVEAVSDDVTLPAPADVLVSEIIWNGGLGEGVVASFADARARLLKPHARIIPARVQMWVAPVQSPGAFESLAGWSEDLVGLDFTAVRDVAADATFTRWFHEDELLAPGEPVGTVDLTTAAVTTFAGEAAFAAARDGTLHGLAAWFAADLAPGVRLSNAPPARGSWMHAYLPVAEEVALRRGDSIRARIEVLTADELWRWSVEAAGVAQEGSTLAPHLRHLRG
jgi:protein arginine N-methyltransferase 1